MKILKIISINLLLVFIILLIGEICCLVSGYKFQQQFIKDKYETIKYLFSRYTTDLCTEYYDVPNNKMRPIEGKFFKKNPIILFGCSVTYGNKLADNENFSGTLSKLTKRPVYNMAGDGWTFAHMLKNLKTNKTIENINPDYIIYTFITDQKRRLFFFQGWPHDTGLYLRYEFDKNHNLVEIIPHNNIFWRSYLVKTIQYKIQENKIANEQKTDELMLKILSESTKIMKNRYPNAKLIMLLYSDADCKKGERDIYPNNQFLTDYEEKAIKDIGFKIVNIEEEMGFPPCTSEYKVDNHHPSAKFWNEFTPKLVRKFNM